MRLNNTRLLFLTVFMLLSASIGTFGAPFTPGNIVVCRVGDGSAVLTNAATSVFADEINPATGIIVQSIPMPTADSGANQILTASGTATSECQITRSFDGRYILITGYDAAVGTLAVVGTATTGATPVVRVIGRIDFDGNVDTTTTTTSFSANNIRSAFSDNGTNIWAAGAVAPGLGYTTIGSSAALTQISTGVTNVRVVNSFGGDLYFSTNSTIQRFTGLPTVATAPTALTFGTAFASSYSFFFTKLGTVENGVDTMYLADDGIGIRKYSLVAGTWTLNGTIGSTTDDYLGLMGRASGTSVTLYATRSRGASADQIVRIDDTAGYNAPFSDTTNPALVNSPQVNGVVTTAADLNRVFRGVASAPVNPTAASGVISGRVLTANGIGINKVRLTLQSASGNESRVAVTNPFGYYTFDDLSLGENYIISVQSKKYAFAQPVQSVNLIQSLEEVNFTAEPNFAGRELTERKTR